jgi:hypothetical protein
MSAQEKRVALLGGTLLLVLSLSKSANAATITFQPAVTYGVGTVPRVVAVADFNGDGNPDLAVVNVGNSGSGNVSILLGNGDGSFLPANSIAAGTHPLSLAVADFDEDGRLDLVVGDAIDGNSGTLELLLGNGDGTFQSTKSFGFEGSISSLVVADFDGDLHADLALAVAAVAPSQPRVAVLLGNGDGTFRQGESILNTGGSILASDFNDDHKVDLVVGKSILLGNGDGTFRPGLGLGVVFQFGAPSSAGDFNRDGKLDLVMAAASFHGESCQSSVEVLLGNGDGTFQAPKDVFDVQSNCSIGLFAATGDLNGDKNLDVVVTESSDLGVKKPGSVFLGNGDGTFQPAVSFDTNSNPGWVSVADLNSDQAPDLVLANSDDNTASVLLNTRSADFSLSASAPTPGTVSRGQNSTSTVTLKLLNTFDSSVALTCSVQPVQSAPTCSFNPNSVTFDPNGNATATLTINTGAATASLVPASLRHDSCPLHFLWLPVAGFALMGAGFSSSRSTRRRLTIFLLGGLLFGGLIFQAACGGGSSGPRSQTYTITVTGASGSTQHSTTTTLTVQ